MRAKLLSVLALGAALAACDGDGELRVTGETGYVRCLAADPPEARSWRVGALRLAIEDRTLRIDGAPAEWRLAAFTGPVDAGAVAALRERRPHLAVLVGGAGGTEAEVSRTLSSLAALGAPVLVVAGGDDRRDLLARAFAGLEGEAKDRVTHASALRSIRVGPIELVPLAGAPEGRYALTNDACGFARADVEALIEAAGAPNEGVRRYLLSWAAPRGAGAASLGVASVEAGSPLVAEAQEGARADGAIFAWPAEAAGRLQRSPLRVALRPLTGRWISRPDGTRARPGATLLRATREGLVPTDGSP
ncbi:MAG TPA: hypothetical protein VIL20_16240 [Sandaracinaceae bacterium]